MEMNFSRVNLEYLIQARDLAREDTQAMAVLLGMPRQLACVLAEVAPEELAQVIAIKAPLLVPRQEPWWWQRLFKAVREGRPDEVEAVIEHASLMCVQTIKAD